MRRIITAAAAASFLAGAASAQVTEFFAVIDADQSDPFSGSPATGTLSGSYDAGMNTFSFSWAIDGLTGTPAAPGAHIHMGAAGQNGPVVFAFNDPDGSWDASGSAVWSGLDTAHVDALFAEGLYVNFHTDLFPSGEVRGQIMPVPAPGAVAMAGALCLLARRRRV